MIIEQIADYINKNESIFSDDNGFLDMEYIVERFDLTKQEVNELKILLKD